jgi:uncharacterized membrane protein YccC
MISFSWARTPESWSSIEREPVMTMRLLISALRPVPGALLRELKSLRLHGPRAREAIRPVLSVLVAVGAAAVLNLDDLSWAAFSGYMVMRGNVAESVPRGLMRIAGTVGGALLGLLLAPKAADSPMLLMAFLFLVSWIGIFQSLTTRYSYAWLFFGLTAGMVLTDALESPESVVHFAATRVTEVTVGTCACLLIACLFAAMPIEAGKRADAAIWCGRLRDFLDEVWLRRHWLLLAYSMRGALAVALLPFVWRWFGIEDFSQTAITSYVVMIVPSAEVRERQHTTIYERMVHRTLGCLLGSATALLCVGFVGTDLPTMVLVLGVGVWLGYSVQTGREGIGYLGTQFTLGMLITLVQGPGPITDVTPGLERLLGIFIGSAMLCLLTLLWPVQRQLPTADSSHRRSRDEVAHNRRRLSSPIG